VRWLFEVICRIRDLEPQSLDVQFSRVFDPLYVSLDRTCRSTASIGHFVKDVPLISTFLFQENLSGHILAIWFGDKLVEVDVEVMKETSFAVDILVLEEHLHDVRLQGRYMAVGQHGVAIPEDLASLGTQRSWQTCRSPRSDPVNS
jgi:hypothetical protein